MSCLCVCVHVSEDIYIQVCCESGSLAKQACGCGYTYVAPCSLGQHLPMLMIISPSAE